MSHVLLRVGGHASTIWSSSPPARSGRNRATAGSTSAARACEFSERSRLRRSVPPASWAHRCSTATLMSTERAFGTAAHLPALRQLDGHVIRVLIRETEIHRMHARAVLERVLLAGSNRPTGRSARLPAPPPSRAPSHRIRRPAGFRSRVHSGELISFTSMPVGTSRFELVLEELLAFGVIFVALGRARRQEASSPV